MAYDWMNPDTELPDADLTQLIVNLAKQWERMDTKGFLKRLGGQAVDPAVLLRMRMVATTLQLAHEARRRRTLDGPVAPLDACGEGTHVITGSSCPCGHWVEAPL